MDENKVEQSTPSSPTMEPANSCFTVTKQQLAITAFTAEDEHRPVLTGVCLRFGMLVAADGFTLAETSVVGPKDLTMLIPGKALQAAVKAKAKGEGSNIVMVRRQDKTPEEIAAACSGKPPEACPPNYDIIISAPGMLGEMKVEPIVGTYPDYQHILPTRAPYAYVALSPEYLKRIALAALANKEVTMVRLFIREPSDPVEFRFSGEVKQDEVHGLVMPMFVSWEELDKTRPQRLEDGHFKWSDTCSFGWPEPMPTFTIMTTGDLHLNLTAARIDTYSLDIYFGSNYYDHYDHSHKDPWLFVEKTPCKRARRL